MAHVKTEDLYDPKGKSNRDQSINSYSNQKLRSMIKAIIIDDEARARSLLKNLISEHCPDIDKVIVAENLNEGVLKIKKEKPQIVLLDIEMPEESWSQDTRIFQ